MEIKDIAAVMEIKDIAAVVGVTISLFVLWKGVLEYGRQGKQKRAEYFLQMRDRIFSDDEFIEVQDSLESDVDETIKQLPLAKKDRFLAFIEEIAILENSKIISTEIAYYMFGYFAIQCWNSEAFWHDIERNDKYWSVFRDFAERMISFEKNRNLLPRSVRL